MHVTLQPGTPEEAGMSAQRVRRIVELAESWVAQGVMSALVVLAARNGVIVVHKACGSLTPEPDSPPLEWDAIFPLSSITKPITATAAMILVEDGLLGLNRPLSWYIPEFIGEGKDAATVHHLLTHTAGIKDLEVAAHIAAKMGSVEIPPPEATQHPLLHQLMCLVYDVPLYTSPGTEMYYSDAGYTLLGEVVRRVSGQSLTDFARERIFEPLGMKDTTYSVPDALKPRIVRREDESTILPPPYVDLEGIPWPAAGAYSTALDMAVFGQMFLNRGAYGDARILSQASVAEMTRNQIPGIGARWGDDFFPEASWGLGWNILGNKRALEDGILRSPETFQHSGAGGAYLWVDPVHEIVGVYFSVAREGQPWCSDLFMNAVTAAVVE